MWTGNRYQIVYHVNNSGQYSALPEDALMNVGAVAPTGKFTQENQTVIHVYADKVAFTPAVMITILYYKVGYGSNFVNRVVVSPTVFYTISGLGRW